MSGKTYRGILLSGQAAEVTVRGSSIASVRGIAAEPGLPRLLPGLADMQHNGALGFPYNEMDERAGEKLAQIGAFLHRHGVVRVRPTLTTMPYETLGKAVKAMDRVLSGDRSLAALFCGIFHEGVFISPEAGWRGSHAPDYILPPDFELFSRLQEKAGGRIRAVNIAPEVEGAFAFIEKAVKSGVQIGIGHCDPDTEQIRRAAACGASFVTHFANGAAAQIHRFKNPFWGFLDTPELALSMIGDGFHLPPEVVRTALKVKGHERCYMVSDANAYSGCPPGEYRRPGGIVDYIEPDGFMHTADRDVLAGAWFQLDHGVGFLTGKCGLAFEDAWRLCSEIPAAICGADLPRLRPDDEASFVVWDGKIVNTVFRGGEFPPEDR